jgi:hypothetical protein
MADKKSDPPSPADYFVTGKKYKFTAVPVGGGKEITGRVFGYFVKLPIDHPVYSLIGYVASEWAHLEMSLDEIIWELLGVKSPDGACVTAQLMSVWPRYNSIISQLEIY